MTPSNPFLEVFETIFGRPFVKRFAYAIGRLSCVSVCLWRWCIVAKRLDGSRCHLVQSGKLCSMGTQLPPQKGHSHPIFGPCLLWPNGWMDQDATWYGGRPRPRPNCVRWGPSSLSLPPKRGHSSSPIFSQCMLWPNGWIDQYATWYGGKPRRRPHCVRWRPIPPPRKKGSHQRSNFSADVYCGQAVAHLSNC